MRKNVLFYTFIAIFVLTALVTLLGVLGAVTIERSYLNALVGAFLIELGGSVVILFRKTDFSDMSDDGLMASLDQSAQIIDRISGQILDVVRGQQSPEDAYAHRMLIRRSGNQLAAYQRFGIITKDDLEALPKKERDHIKVHEQSLKQLKKTWDDLYPKRVRSDGSIDPDTEQRLQHLVSEMKVDLLAILDFIEKRGLYLDDHYQDVRSVVGNFAL